MSKARHPLINEHGEVRNLSKADFDHFKPASDVLPASLQAKLGIKRRGPQKAPTKVATSIRLSPDVLASFKATGKGWQSRIDDALQTYLQEHPVR